MDRILAQEEVQAGDARTSLVEEVPALTRPPVGVVAKGAALALLEQQALGVGSAAHVGAAVPMELPDLSIAEGQRGVAAPMAGSVLSIVAKAGDRVAPGDTLLVVSAMKMESETAMTFTWEISEDGENWAVMMHGASKKE